jgi:hypothetical protein
VGEVPNAWDESLSLTPRAPFRKPGQNEVVYVVSERPGGIVKIGTTKSLGTRLRQLQGEWFDFGSDGPCWPSRRRP